MRGIYGKFMLTVTAIIAVSFVLLFVVLSAEAQVYSDGLLSESARSAAWSANRYITLQWQEETEKQDITFAEYAASFDYDVGQSNAFADGMILLIADKNGRPLHAPLADAGTDTSYTDGLTASLLAQFEDEVPLMGQGFDSPIAYLLPVVDDADNVVGYLVATVHDTSLVRYTNTVIATIALTSIVVLSASLILFFIMSRRTIGPLKQIGYAAKQFSQGKFDVRVLERGSGEMADLARSFNHMADSIAKTDELRRTFLSNVSHDLRTPMTVIAGFVDGILDGTIPKEKQGEYLALVSNEVRRLSRLVTTLLDVTRLQAGERKFHPESFDVCEMAREILISFAQRIEDKELAVNFESDAESMYAWADRDAIYQILYNLCDNGVKFARAGGIFSVSITTRGGKQYITVYNEGEGIPKSEQPYVFDRFYKADKSRGLDTTGVGLGLYIAKTILDSVGEEITVHSEPGENCTFAFTLPASDPPKRAKESM